METGSKYCKAGCSSKEPDSTADEASNQNSILARKDFGA